MRTSYFSLLGDDLGQYIINNIFTPIFDAIMDALSVVLYGIQIGLFHIINAIQGIVKGLVGLQPHWIEVEGVVQKVNSDPAISFLQDPKVQSTFLSILIAALFLLIITTFVGIIKTEFDKKDNSKTPVIENAIKGLAYFFVVPITCFLGVFVANVVLKMLDKATSNGAVNFSNQIFVAAAYDSNRIRRDHDSSAVGAAYKYYISRSNTHEIITPFTDYVLNIVNNNCYEVTIVEDNEFKTVYAYKKEYFLNSPTEGSEYTNLNPKMFLDEFKEGVYYTSLNSKEQFFVDNVIDIKIALGERGYFEPKEIYQLDVNSEVEEPPSATEGTHVISIKQKIDGIEGEVLTDIASIKYALSENYYYFFTKNLSSENSYYSTNASFHQELKLSEGAIVEFPMQFRIDWLGTAATTLKIIVGMGGDYSENIGDVEVVKITGFDNADYEAFANWVDNQFLTGYFSITNFGEASTFYSLGYYNYIIGYIASGMIVTMLINLIIGCIQRIFEISVLFVVSPAVISLMPLDGGDRYKAWRGEFIKRVFSAYGPILGMNLAFMVLQMIQSTKLKLFPPHEDLYNGIVYILIMFTALVCVKSLTKMVTGLVGQGDALSDGENTMKNVKDMALKTAGVLSSAAAMPIALARRGMDMMKKHQDNNEKFYDHTYFDSKGNSITEDEFKAGRTKDGTLIDRSQWQLGRDRWANAASASVRKQMKQSAAAIGADTRTRRLLDYGYTALGAHKDLANTVVDTFMDDDKKKDIIKKIGKGTPLGKILKAPLDAKDGKKAIKDTADKMKTEAAAKEMINKSLPKDKQLTTTPGVQDVVMYGNQTNTQSAASSGSNSSSGGASGSSRAPSPRIDIAKVRAGDADEIRRAKHAINREIGLDSTLTPEEKKVLGQKMKNMSDSQAVARVVTNNQNGQSAKDSVSGVRENATSFTTGQKVAQSVKESDVAKLGGRTGDLLRERMKNYQKKWEGIKKIIDNDKD